MGRTVTLMKRLLVNNLVGRRGVLLAISMLLILACRAQTNTTPPPDPCLGVTIGAMPNIDISNVFNAVTGSVQVQESSTFTYVMGTRTIYYAVEKFQPSINNCINWYLTDSLDANVNANYPINFNGDGQGGWNVYFDYINFNYWRSGREQSTQTFTVKAESKLDSTKFATQSFTVTFVRDCTSTGTGYNEAKEELGTFEYYITDPTYVINYGIYTLIGTNAEWARDACNYSNVQKVLYQQQDAESGNEDYPFEVNANIFEID